VSIAVAVFAVAALFAWWTVSVGWAAHVATASLQQRPSTAPIPSEERARLEGRPVDAEHLVRVWTIVYRAYDGFLRHAYVVLPRWYGPKNNPPVPLVISPHGRGAPATSNVKMWGDLSAIGRFAVVNPEGQGRRLTLYSWGDPEEIHDLSRMPRFIHEAMPWLRIAKDRVYAFGDSMGGQETLLLVARYPEMLDGAAAFDSPTNLKARYYALTDIAYGSGTQALLRLEVGGAPSQVPHAYAIRSPLDWANQIAFSRIPLQIWWSTRDQIVTDQAQESGLLYREIKKLNRAAPVLQFVGTWQHGAEMRHVLPRALALFGLMPPFHAHAPGLTI
jgi:pimeloyl-ACP methyl ester carboxylesterase